MMKKKMFALSCLFLSVAQAEGFYCPNTAHYVNVGDNMAVVEQACGKPTTTKTKKINITEPVPVEQWLYRPYRGTDNEPKQPPVTISFKEGKVSEITVADEKMENTICNGTVIQKGSTQEDVLVACDKPTFLHRAQAEDKVGTREIVEWTYQFGAYQPSATFRFEAGILTSINSDE